MSLTTRLFTRRLRVTPRAEDTSGVTPENVDGAPYDVLGALWQRSSRDILTSGETVDTDAAAAWSTSRAVSSGDQVTDLETGLDYQIDGEPHHVWHPLRQQMSHVEVALRRRV